MCLVLVLDCTTDILQPCGGAGSLSNFPLSVGCAYGIHDSQLALNVAGVS